MSRRKSSVAEESGQPTFEEALTRLEEIVESMEHEHLPLEDLVGHYENGSALLARCETILHSARGRIELITLRNRSEIALEAAGNPADAPTPTAPDDLPDDPDDDDIRLF